VDKSTVTSNPESTRSPQVSQPEDGNQREIAAQHHRYRKRNQQPREHPSNDHVYNFNHGRRGAAILIVNYEFQNSKLDRPYATKDEEIFTSLLGALNFEIKPLINKTTTDLLSELRSELCRIHDVVCVCVEL